MHVDTRAMRETADVLRKSCDHLSGFVDMSDPPGPLGPSEAVFGEFVPSVLGEFRSAWHQQGQVISDAMSETADKIDESATRYEVQDAENQWRIEHPGQKLIPE
jgi:hypothetical protein